MSGALLALAASMSGGPVVSITNQSITDTQSIIPASAGYELTSGGITRALRSTGPTTIANWITPAVGMSGYEARATQTATNGNGLTVGTLNTWLNLGTTRAWSVDVSGGSGTGTRTFTIEIRDAATLVVLTTASISLVATST